MYLQHLDSNIQTENLDTSVEEIQTSHEEDQAPSTFEIESEDDDSIKFDANSSRLENSLHFNDYCGEVEATCISSVRNQSSQTSPSAVNVSTQTDN